MALRGFQRKHLRGLAHGLRPVVLIGQRGATVAAIEEISSALDRHELIKIKFNGVKNKALKNEIAAGIEKQARCEMVGLIGHTAILYRQQPDPEKRRIALLERVPHS